MLIIFNNKQLEMKLGFVFTRAPPQYAIKIEEMQEQPNCCHYVVVWILPSLLIIQQEMVD